MARPKGLPKTGGRQKGAANRKTREIADKAAVSGLLPLDVMLQTMRWHWENERRDDASKIAKDAAPYLHPRLESVEHSGADGGPIEIVTKFQRDAAVSAALRADS